MSPPASKGDLTATRAGIQDALRRMVRDLKIWTAGLAVVQFVAIVAILKLLD